jgi:putative endopeptidase
MRKLIRRLAVLVAGTAVGMSAACGSAPPPPPPGSGLSLVDFDRAVRPGDDLFNFANGSWLRNTQIPPDMSEYGSFSMLSERSQDEQHTIIEEAAKDTSAPANSDQRKIGDMYASYMDTARLDQLRATPLAADFAAIDRLANPTDLLRHLGEIQRYGVSNPIGLTVVQDAKDATSYITDVFQGGTSLPDRDYYLSGDPKFTAVTGQYRTYTAKMLSLAGLPDPEGNAARVFDLEAKLAGAQWSKVRNRDAVATYNKFTVAQATAATGLDWSVYLAAAGVNQPDLVVDQPSFFGELAGLLRSVPLDTWKQYLKWHLLQDYAPYLSSDFVNARFDFVGKVLSGQEQNRERWKRGVTAVNSVLGEPLGRLYVAKYFAPQAKQRAEALVHNLTDAYRSSIQSLDWMSPATKAAAEDKLSKLAVKIGYPDKWRDYSTLVIKRDDLVGNLQRAAQLGHQRALDKLGKPVDRSEWFMNPQTVNAYYNPPMNEIVFPAAILQQPFFNPQADDAINYGAIGAVIGHEISHAFDDQGRRYDGDGNLRDWWTPEDAQRFTAKTQALVAQYNSYSPLPGTQVNGELTLGENIADLSGLTVAHRAYLNSLRGTPSPVLDGFTGDQRFFLGYAQIWRSKERDESLRNSLLTDVHSPGMFRTNGVVPNVDAFYQAFDVKPGDKLYRPPAERIHIW